MHGATRATTVRRSERMGSFGGCHPGLRQAVTAGMPYGAVM